MRRRDEGTGNREQKGRDRAGCDFWIHGLIVRRAGDIICKKFATNFEGVFSDFPGFYPGLNSIDPSGIVVRAGERGAMGLG